MTKDTRLARAVTRAVEHSLLSAADLAEKAGISYDALASWRLERRSPSAQTALKIASVLDKQAKALTRAAEMLRKEVGRE